MSAEDYIDMYDFWDGPDCQHDVSSPRYPVDFPCKMCHFSKNFKCTRIKGVQKCPHADWFAEHNGKG